MLRPIQPEDRVLYLQMSRDFFSSDAVLHDIPEENRLRTFEALMSHSPYTACYMLTQADQTAGYALLALTWSQEAGGLVVWVEELYVRPAFRGQGLGKDFVCQLRALYPDAVRFRLEVEPENHRAAAFYQAAGYDFLKYQQMFCDYPLQNT